eukprot:5675969-Pyramimonas_sp.AAC.1
MYPTRYPLETSKRNLEKTSDGSEGSDGSGKASETPTQTTGSEWQLPRRSDEGLGLSPSARTSATTLYTQATMATAPSVAPRLSTGTATTAKDTSGSKVTIKPLLSRFATEEFNSPQLFADGFDGTDMKPLVKPLHHWRVRFSPRLFADGFDDPGGELFCGC